MLKNTLQFIRHNLKNGKSIMILLSVVMIICGPVPAFLVFSDRLHLFNLSTGVEKMDYARAIERTLLRLFDISGEQFYHTLLSLIAAVSGLVLAFVLFYYFRKKESADFFLSLPLTRTEAYIANFASGTLYYIIPLAVTSLVTIIGLTVMGALDFVNISKLILGSADYTGLLALLGTNIVFFLLFFALGAIASLISSNGLNALVVYGTINFYPIVFMGLLLASSEIFNNDIIDFQETILRNCLYLTPIVRPLVFFEFPPTVWTYVLIPLFTVGFALLGCYLCNKRPAETWSSAIIYKPLRLVLQYMYCFIVAFAAGLFFYYITNRSLLNIMIGAALGLVLSFMILNIIFERDVKAIFKKPLRLAWSAVIFISVFLVIVMDVFGIFRYRQPAFSSVEYVNVNLNKYVVNSYYPANLAKDYGTSKIDDPEAKEAAIKLYSMLHEEIRNDNYSYYLGRSNTDPNSFDATLRSHTSGSSTTVEMIRNGKVIRPLRNSYFENHEAHYELFKAIYDCDQYVDSIIPLLNYAEIKGAQITTSLLRSYGAGESFSLRNVNMSERLHTALLEDFAEVDFDGLQSMSPYVISIYFNMIPGEYKDVYERVMVTDEYYGDSYIEAERHISFVVPKCFTRTLAIIEENREAIDTIQELHESIYDKITYIFVRKFTPDGKSVSETTTVTDKAEIARIMNDLYYLTGRTPTFPKYGISLDVYREEDQITEDEKYYEYYKDPVYAEQSATRRAYNTVEFLQRFSDLY